MWDENYCNVVKCKYLRILVKLQIDNFISLKLLKRETVIIKVQIKLTLQLKSFEYHDITSIKIWNNETEKYVLFRMYTNICKTINLKRYFLPEIWVKLCRIQGIIKNSFHSIRKYSENSDVHSSVKLVSALLLHSQLRTGDWTFIKRFPLPPWCRLRNHEIYDIQRTLSCRVTNHEDLHPLLVHWTNFLLFIEKITTFT